MAANSALIGIGYTRAGANCLQASRAIVSVVVKTFLNKKAQLSLTNPRDACEKFARFT